MSAFIKIMVIGGYGVVNKKHTVWLNLADLPSPLPYHLYQSHTAFPQAKFIAQFNTFFEVPNFL
jgi:hypothetical protein